MTRQRKHRPAQLRQPPASQDLVLADHLREIRRRMAWPFSAFIIAAIACYLIYDEVFALLKAPLHAPLYFTSPQGGFNVMMGICLAAGVIAAIPPVVYHLLMFLSPVLPKFIKRTSVATLALISFILACTGAGFALDVVIPLVLHFFTGFQTAGLSALITASSYFDLVTKLLVTFALIFQLPLILWTINRIKPLSPRQLLRFEKYVIVGSVGVGVLVPFAFDLTTQALIALPIVVLYNLSILVVVIDNRLRHSKPRTVHQPHPVDATHHTSPRTPRVPSKSKPPVPTLSRQRLPNAGQTRRPATLQAKQRQGYANKQPARGLPPNAPPRQGSRANERGRGTPRSGGLISEFVK